MRRREFIKNAAAGVTSFYSLAGQDEKISDRLGKLHSELLAKKNDAEFWNRVRNCFQLSPEITHLNCGSIGTCPEIVTNAMFEYTREIEKNPFRNLWGDGLCEKLESVRESAAQFINAATDEIVITRNTTEGMNLVARGLDLKRGDEVLTTNHEHPGGMACWQHLAKRRGVRVVCLKMPVPAGDSDEFVELVRTHISPKTKVFSFSHIDSVTGYVLPIARISELSKQHGIFFVCDGAQVPGMLSVDVKQLSVDAYASSSHKWMLAPKGSGLLYISKTMQPRVNSMELSSGLQVYTASTGIRDIAKILAHSVAIDFLNLIGKKKIERRVRTLNRYLSNKLEESKSVRRLIPDNDEHSSGIVTLAIDRSISSFKLTQQLMNTFKIYVKPAPVTYALVPGDSIPRENYNAIRFSTHIFNDEQQIDHAVDTIAGILDEHKQN